MTSCNYDILQRARKNEISWLPTSLDMALRRRRRRELSAFLSVVKLGNVSASDSLSKANLLNSFCASTFSPHQPYKLYTSNRTLLMLKDVVPSTRAFERFCMNVMTTAPLELTIEALLSYTRVPPTLLRLMKYV